MTEINNYVRAVFFLDILNVLSVPDGFTRQGDIVGRIKSAIDASLTPYNAVGVTDTLALANEVFSEAVKANVIVERRDIIAGSYFRFSAESLKSFRSEALKANSAYVLSREIGSNFFSDVFDAYLGRVESDFDVRDPVEVPASDRIVSIDHNQIASVEAPISALVEQLERDNGIPESPGVKERLLGQIKAGRELLRSGNFRAYLLYATLIRALGELMERYKGHAIAMVAASLVDMLVKNVLQSS